MCTGTLMNAYTRIRVRSICNIIQTRICALRACVRVRVCASLQHGQQQQRSVVIPICMINSRRTPRRSPELWRRIIDPGSRRARAVAGREFRVRRFVLASGADWGRCEHTTIHGRRFIEQALQCSLLEFFAQASDYATMNTKFQCQCANRFLTCIDV